MRPQTHLSVESMCRLAQVSRAGFYRHWQEREPRSEETELRAEVQRIALTHRRNYGYRRVTEQLRSEGWAINRKRIARLMAEDNLLCLRRRRFAVTTDSGHQLRVHLNLAARMELTGIDQLWVADITYIRLAEQFLYLAVVLDAHSRRVVGWALDERLDATLAVCALRQAIDARQPAPGLVHHSDRGVQYASAAYAELARRARHRAQHEPSRQSLRQRPMRKLHENPQTGGDLHPPLSRPGRSGGPHRAVYRALLQSQTAALGARLPHPGGLRAQPAPASDRGAGGEHEFFQA